MNRNINKSYIFLILFSFVLSVIYPGQLLCGGDSIILMGQTATGTDGSSTGQGGTSSYQSNQGTNYGNQQNTYCPYGSNCTGNQNGIQIQQMPGGQAGFVVRVGDRLYVVANIIFMNPYGWQDIYNQNSQNIQNPNNLQVGSVLTVPNTNYADLSFLIDQNNQNNGISTSSSNPMTISGSKPFTGSVNYGVTPGFNWSQPNQPANSYTSNSSYTTNQQQQQVTSSSTKFNVTSPIQSGTVTSNFGPRTLRGEPDNHSGIDIGAAAGTSITSTGAGKVIFSGNQSGYGNVVKVQHADGTITIYGHCKTLNVRVGQTVGAGQQIATVNSTGNSTGNHLHFEIKKNGTSIDPRTYFTFPAKGSTVKNNIVARS